MSTQEQRCRLCAAPLDQVLDLGEQCLAGRFPRPDDPPLERYPLRLAVCSKCGLVQLDTTVSPLEVFQDYRYRSSVTLTMRQHLQGIVKQALSFLGRNPRQVLDIGSNDGYLLSQVTEYTDALLVGIDPCFVEPASRVAERRVTHLPAFYPHPLLAGRPFDLVFSIANFYDVDEPHTFLEAVWSNLTEGGLFVVEVAHLEGMLRDLRYDCLCHEHRVYYEARQLESLLKGHGFHVEATTWTAMNGGSVRFLARKQAKQPPGKSNQLNIPGTGNIIDVPWNNENAPIIGNLASIKEASAQLSGYPLQLDQLDQFAQGVANHREQLRAYLDKAHARGLRVHWLGASTKSNTVLQYAGVDAGRIQAVSDRDPTKDGCVTPGTNLPILSEEGSRQQNPDRYLTVLDHFQKEILGRERGFFQRGGKVVFVLPHLQEVSGL